MRKEETFKKEGRESNKCMGSSVPDKANLRSPSPQRATQKRRSELMDYLKGEEEGGTSFGQVTVLYAY